MNTQPWHFIVVTKSAVLDRISQQAKQWTLDHEPALAANPHLHGMLSDPSVHILYHAPALIAVATSEPSKWGREGCAMAAQNIMLAAAAQGLGSCWIGLAEGFLNSAAGRELIELSATANVVAPIIIGHPRQMPQPSSRKSPRIVWIDDGNTMTEDGERAEIFGGRGFYGTLVHP
jgi:nitroreductase